MLSEDIENRGVRLPWSGCLIWTHAASKAGYGQVRINKTARYVHRIAWEKRFGPIPNGMQICHHCDTPACYNTDHLFVGSMQDNMDDKCRKGRQVGCSIGEKRAAKLTADQVRAIRKDKRAGRVIAEQYRLSESNVSAIRNLVTWRDV